MQQLKKLFVYLRASETEPIQFDYNQNAFTVGAKVSQMLISANSVKKDARSQKGGVISANSAKKTHVFRKGPSFLRIIRKRRTFPKGRIRRFSK